MTGVLLDTSAYSAFKRGHPEICRLLQESEAIVINAVAIGELLAGFRRGGQASKNEKELTSFLVSPRVKTAPLDEDTAQRYALIHDSLWRAGTPVPTNDIWIAATAMQYGFAVLTTDGHFRKIPQVLSSVFPPA